MEGVGAQGFRAEASWVQGFGATVTIQSIGPLGLGSTVAGLGLELKRISLHLGPKPQTLKAWLRARQPPHLARSCPSFASGKKHHGAQVKLGDCRHHASVGALLRRLFPKRRFLLSAPPRPVGLGLPPGRQPKDAKASERPAPHRPGNGSIQAAAEVA